MIPIPKIIGDIWSSSEIFSPINYLADTIGPRPTGSSGNMQAVAYLEEQFAKRQLLVEKQSFEVKIWEYEEVQLRMDNHMIEAVPFGYTGVGEAKGPILPLINPNPKQIEKIEFKNKVVTYLNSMGGMGAMGGRGLSREDLITKAAEKGAAAFIEVSNKLGGVIERRNLKSTSSIPSIAVSYEDGNYLLRRKKEVSISLSGQERTVTSENVVARTSENTEKKIVLTAHYDTAPESPGAFDNASGVATLLELARVFSKLEKLPYSLEFVGLGASKWGFCGAVNYLDKYLQQSPTLVMNFDNTAKPGGTRNGVLANDMRLFGMNKKLVSDYGFDISFTPMPIFGTDATIFFKKKYPIFVLNQWKAPTFINTPYDTPEKLSIDSIKNSTSIAGAILANVQNIAGMMKMKPEGISGGKPKGHPGSM
ncbi:MAG: M28 family peptidase [Candidatus Heimdallarchaeota archaeon]|nr:M28 family peptidase [Candidatus Heimdallarchaeota archaeon]